ncbi:HAMP domain-containing protein [Candidatus Ozemobacteraceae bacterium]|nr:HAMP domain-containing protein [Candidatus Ozemobacteraceae bacterium]
MRTTFEVLIYSEPVRNSIAKTFFFVNDNNIFNIINGVAAPPPGTLRSGTPLSGLLLFLLLLAVPFASINAGVSFLAARERAWQERSLESDARRELETLTNSAAAAPYLERSAAALRVLLSRNEPLPAHFPPATWVAGLDVPHDLWVFEDDVPDAGDRPPRVVLASSPMKLPPRVLSTAFACLAHHALNARLSPPALKRGEKLLVTAFGTGQSASHLAMYQRSIPTRVIHERASALLLWNGVILPDGRRRGFFLIFRDLDAVTTFGLASALRAHRRRGGAPAGFVRTLRSNVHDLLPGPLMQSESFRRWRRNLRPHSNRSDWEIRGTPSNLRLDEGRLFTRHLTTGRHMAVLLKPDIPKEHLPVPVFLANLLVCGGILLFVTRGVLLGAWPALPFGIRFSALFALSALLPISLMLIGSHAFIRESANTERNAVITRIRSALEGVDSARERLSGSFQTSFLRMLQAPVLRERLAKHGLDAPGLLDLIRNQFRDEHGKNQLMFVAVMDSQGLMRASSSRGYPLNALEGLMRFCRTGLLRSLRNNRVRQAGPGAIGPETLTEEDKAFIAGYDGATGNSIASEAEQTRAAPFDYHVGPRRANILYDLVAIDGIDTYAVIIAWNADDLANRIILNNLAEAQLRTPGGLLAAYRHRHGRMARLTPATRHETAALLHQLQHVARSAAQRNGPVIEITPETARIALPSRGFQGFVFAAAADTAVIQAEESFRRMLVSMLAVFCMVLVLLSGRITARRMLRPILALREALENVGRGDLSVSITDPRPDELGRLSVAFGAMVEGLRERRRLASLVSDQAIATLESAADPGMALSAGTLDGIILTSDIRGFTPLCETRPPSEITHLLERHFAAMAPLIAAEGGRIDKFIGDAIQAVFIESPDRAPAVIRAIRAGHAMLGAMASINRERRAAGSFTYQAGIGIAGGRLLSGAIGHPSTRLDFALLGPAIARAAELEALTKLVPMYPIAVDAALAPLLGEYSAHALPVPGHEQSTLAIAVPEDYIFDSISTKANLVSPSPEENSFMPPLSPANQKTASTSRFQFSEGIRWKWAFAFLPGLLFLALPFVSLFVATDSRLNGTLGRTVREALETHDMAMLKLRVTNPVIHMIEDRIDQVCDRLAVAFQGSDPDQGGEMRLGACRDAMSELASLEFRPTLAAVLYRRPETPPASWPLVFCTGTDETTTPHFLRDLLAKGACNFEGTSIQSMPAVASGIPALVGKNVGLGRLEVSMLNEAVPATRNGENTWFYWRPILHPFEIRGTDIATSASPLSPRRNRHRPVIGYLLAIFPRHSGDEVPLHTLLKLLNASGMEVRIDSRPATGGASAPSTLFSPHFPLGLSESASGLVENRGVRYVVSKNETIIADTQLTLTLATPLPSSAEDFTRKPPVAAALILLYLAGAGVWFRTIFRGGGLAKSLFSQLLTGFLAAALLPFSAILAGTARFSAEDIHIRTRNERFDLVQQLDEVDRLHQLRYPFVWDRIERLANHPAIMRAIRNSQHAPSTKAPGTADTADEPALATMLGAVKDASLRGRLPYYIKQIILAAPGGWKFHLKEGDAEESETQGFSFYLSSVASLLFGSLGDAPARSNVEGPLGSAVKREMATEIAFSIFRSVFISDISYPFLYSPLVHILLPGGNGIFGISNVLLPDVERPRGFISITYNASHMEQDALQHVIRDNPSRFALFGCQLQHCATMIRPDLGGMFTPIAGIARWTQAGNTPMSFRTGNGSFTFLVETRPGVHNPRMFLAAAASELPLLAATRNVRNGLFLWLAAGILATVLLAWRSAVDLISPVRGLEAGMKELAAGRFETRIVNYRTDEIGDLQRSFDRMARSLQERELIRTMMSSEARKSAESTSHADEAADGAAGERIDAVIAMTGVPGFQSRMASMPTDDLFEALTSQTALLCDLFIGAGGDVDKVIGEKLLVVFRGGSQAENASRLLKALARLRDDSVLCPPFPVSVGISAGPVISGFIGSGARRDHTVIGDTVNTAARLLAHADKLSGRPRIVFSSSCRSLFPVETPFESLGNVSVKGKSEPIDIYRLLPYETEHDGR